MINYYGAVNIFLKNVKNVFIGKSLVKKLIKVGGQNPIEAAKMGCCIFHGPFVSNFHEILYVSDLGMIFWYDSIMILHGF